ncbi:MAG: (2Fe-2S)-binding protein [Pseudomonadota bacterium]
MTVRFTFDGETFEAPESLPLSHALLLAGRSHLRNAPDGAPRGMWCAMGGCQECVVLVDGQAVEACRLPVRNGLEVYRR